MASAPLASGGAITDQRPDAELGRLLRAPGGVLGFPGGLPEGLPCNEGPASSSGSTAAPPGAHCRPQGRSRGQSPDVGGWEGGEERQEAKTTPRAPRSQERDGRVSFEPSPALDTSRSRLQSSLVPISQIRKMKPREIQRPTQGHIASGGSICQTYCMAACPLPLKAAAHAPPAPVPSPARVPLPMPVLSCPLPGQDPAAHTPPSPVPSLDRVPLPMPCLHLSPRGHDPGRCPSAILQPLQERQ